MMDLYLSVLSTFRYFASNKGFLIVSFVFMISGAFVSKKGFVTGGLAYKGTEAIHIARKYQT